MSEVPVGEDHQLAKFEESNRKLHEALARLSALPDNTMERLVRLKREREQQFKQPLEEPKEQPKVEPKEELEEAPEAKKQKQEIDVTHRADKPADINLKFTDNKGPIKFLVDSKLAAGLGVGTPIMIGMQSLGSSVQSAFIPIANMTITHGVPQVSNLTLPVASMLPSVPMALGLIAVGAAAVAGPTVVRNLADRVTRPKQEHHVEMTHKFATEEKKDDADVPLRPVVPIDDELIRARRDLRFRDPPARVPTPPRLPTPTPEPVRAPTPATEAKPKPMDEINILHIKRLLNNNNATNRTLLMQTRGKITPDHLDQMTPRQQALLRAIYEGKKRI